MAGQIQTAIGQMMGAIGGAALVGKGVAEDEAKRQADKKAEAKAAEEQARKEAVAKALSQATSYKIIDPIYFWKNEEPLATSDEMASLASGQSLYNYRNTKLRTRKGIQARLGMLKNKSGATASYGNIEPKKEGDYTYGG